MSLLSVWQVKLVKAEVEIQNTKISYCAHFFLFKNSHAYCIYGTRVETSQSLSLPTLSDFVFVDNLGLAAPPSRLQQYQTLSLSTISDWLHPPPGCWHPPPGCPFCCRLRAMWGETGEDETGRGAGCPLRGAHLGAH